jgi:PhnB protein
MPSVCAVCEDLTMTERTSISLMLPVSDASAAARWYAEAMGATELWNLGGVVGLEVAGAPFFLGEPEHNRWATPEECGNRTVRVEVFVDDPDVFVARAVKAGADASHDPVRNHEVPWGVHRQGSFVDPFGHLWLVGDRSPLRRLADAGLWPIGTVASPRTEAIDDDWDAIDATITLDPARFTAEALRGLDEFSHVEVVYLLDRVDPGRVTTLARRPRDNPDWPEVGIFAQRAKGRPNRIAVSVARLLAVDGLRLTVRSLDAIDGTPVRCASRRGRTS